MTRQGWLHEIGKLEHYCIVSGGYPPSLDCQPWREKKSGCGAEADNLQQHSIVNPVDGFCRGSTVVREGRLYH